MKAFRTSSRKLLFGVAALLPAGSLHTFAGDTDATRRFDFGAGVVAPGFVPVQPATFYSAESGYGLEAGARVSALGDGAKDAVRGDALVGEQAFYFSVVVPEGNHRVTVTLGDPTGAAATATTVKAELRRLMIENATTKQGEVVTHTFLVNVRTPKIAARNGLAEGRVELKAPRETTQEAWAWDDRLTLEFNGARPAVCAVEIEPAGAVPTIFLLGDSTVCDQSREPFASWGQMLTALFAPEAAIANHGESGESYRDSLARRRLDKIISVMRPGDVLLMQFGHNDQKQRGEGRGPFLSYKDEIECHVAAVRAAGGVPVVVSPMERRNFDEAGRIRPSLADFAAGAREAAAEAGAAFIDLHAMSISLYEALGPEKSVEAFAVNSGRVDNAHHNNYGAYQLARCVAEGMREAGLEVVNHLRADFAAFNPARPDSLESFAVPPSPLVTTVTPLGN